MKKTVNINIKLTKEEVANIIIDHLINNGFSDISRLSLDNITLKSVTREEAIPGIDIHDCHYISVFDGLALDGSYETDI